MLPEKAVSEMGPAGGTGSTERGGHVGRKEKGQEDGVGRPFRAVTACVEAQRADRVEGAR